MRRPLARLAAAALLLAAVLVVFGEAGSFGFVDYDDGDYVFRNAHLREGTLAARARWALTTFHAANWHPLTWLSFVADAELFGLAPGRLHAENVLLHGANALLLLALVARATGAPGAALVVAALFALHPLRAESVAWVTERKGLLMALCSLLALHAHLALARRPSRGRALLVAALVAAALAAKPQAVALPALLLLLDWWPLGRLGPRPRPAAWAPLLREKIPLLLLSAAATALTVAAQRSGGAIASVEALPLGERLAAAAVAPFAYLAKTLWPAGLAPAYPFRQHPAWLASGALALLGLATAAALRWRATLPWLAAGWLGFLALLAPVSNLFQVGGQALADRYTYLPHIPLLLAGAWAGSRALARRPRARAATVAALIVVAALLGVAARRQTALWRDDETLFSHAVAATSGNWKMHYNLANTLERRGRDAEAQRQYELALAARPGYPEALSNLGALRGRQGEGAHAEALFQRAVAADPGYAPGWFNLGYQREASGRLADAAAAYGRAAALQPGSARPRARLGFVLLRLGRPAAALEACREALRLDPASGEAATCVHQAAGAAAAGER